MNDRDHLGISPGPPMVAEYRWNSEMTPSQQLTPDSDGNYLIPVPQSAARYFKCAGIRIIPAPWSSTCSK